jgi:hypothetical protein
MLMICPVCKQLSTFHHYYEVINQYKTTVKVSDGKPAVDYDDPSLEGEFEMDDEPNVCVCEKCENEIEVDRIKVVHE